MKIREKFALFLVLTMVAALLPINLVAVAYSDIYPAGVGGEVIQLETSLPIVTPPAITLDGTVISWDAVEGAVEYNIFVNGSWFSWTAGTYFDLRTWLLDLCAPWPNENPDTNRDFSIQVSTFAVLNGGGHLSEPSNAVSITAQTITPVTEVEIIDGRTLRWHTTGATNYAIYRNGERVASVNSWASNALQSWGFLHLGLDAGTHNFQVRAVCSNAFGWSNLSESATATLTIGDLPRLATPTGLSITDNILSWNRVVGAAQYLVIIEREFDNWVEVNGEWVVDGKSWFRQASRNVIGATSLDLRTFNWLEEDIQYRARVMAVGNLVTALDSELSEPIEFFHDGTAMPQLAAPEISIDGSVISWNAVPNASEQYHVYTNGVWTRSVDHTSFDLRFLQNLPVGVPVQVQVRALSNEWSRFQNSELSNEVTFTPDGTLPPPLTRPNPSINGSIVSWNAVPDARFYRVWSSSDNWTTWQWADVNGTSVDMRVIAGRSAMTFEAGVTYAIQIEAFCNVLFRRSNASNTVFYTYMGDAPPSLPAPSVSLNGGILSWSSPNALNFAIYINGSREVDIAGNRTSFDMRTVNLPNGVYQIQLRALNGERFLDSPLSNTISLTLPVPPTPPTPPVPPIPPVPPLPPWPPQPPYVPGTTGTCAYWDWRLFEMQHAQNQAQQRTPQQQTPQPSPQPTPTPVAPPTPTPAPVSNQINILLNVDSNVIYDLETGQPVFEMDVLPVIVDGRTLVPVRFVTYALGAEIAWTPATDSRPLTVFLNYNGNMVSFGEGEIVDGMDVPAQIIGNRTMVPLRFVSQFFEARVTWFADTRNVEIVK